MKSILVALISLILVLTFVSANPNAGVASTTRYWDCCKPSCAWPGRTSNGSVAKSCAKDGKTVLTDVNSQNICNGGVATLCTNYQPFGSGDTLYGFASANNDCCSCYELLFLDTALAGKKMIVQVINNIPIQNHFDLLIPGGGTGIFDTGCPAQFGNFNGGERYGGVSSASECANLPVDLRAGCYWRFNQFMNANYPNVQYQRVTCPAVLTSRSGCSA